MPSVSDLSGEQGRAVRVLFASGTAELNRLVFEQFQKISSEFPLVVVSEFEPAAGEWIPWHVQRSFEQNVALVKTALAGRKICAAGVVYDRRSALGELRRAAHLLAPGVLTAWDENMHAAGPESLGSFVWRRRWAGITRQLSPGGRAHAWLRRIAHPAEAEIPLRARAAQSKGLAAGRLRGAGKDAPLELRAASLTPGVSVVIPTRDGLELLREMLPPLLAQTGRGEIVIVDNGSTDETAAWIEREHPGIRVIRHAAPLSFAKAVNLGIQEAQYSRVLLLNNDMIVEPGFVEALERGFEAVPELICATAQIFFPAGVRREETGKTVWRRENELDFPVRCDDPVAGEDLSWVLYGSGGCSLFDTRKLAELGGVSEVYDPAYVEDLDFGYRAWKRGWPTVYCAGARVEHRHRSTTSRFYSERQIDFFVERNYLRFVANAVTDVAVFERLWLEGIRRLQLQAMAGRGAALDTLRDVPKIAAAAPAAAGPLTEQEILDLGNGDVAVFPGLAAERTGGTVLIASPYLPFPLSHGGAVRIFNLMRAAAEDRNLILMAFSDELAQPDAEILKLCRAVVVVRRHGSHYRRDTARPDMVEEFDSGAFRAAIKQAVHQWRPEIVQLEFTWMAQYAAACRPAKTILVEHDITFDLQAQLLDTAAAGSTARLELEGQLAKWRNFETAAWGEVDCVVTMSGKDAAAVRGARAVECLPNGVDCDRFVPSDTVAEAGRILLIGSFAHLPNLLGLEFFLREVWPALGEGYTLHVIGGQRHEFYLDFFRNRVELDLGRPGIFVEGFVADVRDAYRKASIVIAPLTASAGTNIKVLEAMAMGKAVVSTPAGVNGLDVAAGRDCVVTETAEAMAEAIEELTGNAERRGAIGAQARETALRYDWKAMGQRQKDLYAKIYGK